VKEFHSTTYADYETIATRSNICTHTKQAPRSPYFLFFSFFSRHCRVEYVKNRKICIHAHLTNLLLLLPRFLLCTTVFLFFFFLYSYKDNQLHIENDATIILMLLLCAYVYPLSTASFTNTSLTPVSSTTNDCYCCFFFFFYEGICRSITDCLYNYFVRVKKKLISIVEFTEVKKI